MALPDRPVLDIWELGAGAETVLRGVSLILLRQPWTRAITDEAACVFLLVFVSRAKCGFHNIPWELGQKRWLDQDMIPNDAACMYMKKVIRYQHGGRCEESW